MTTLIFNERSKFFIVVFFTVLFIRSTASAITIDYTATDQPDNSSGDLWQYDYTITDYSFSKFEEFTILFDYILYDLISPLNTLPDWDIYTLQSESGIQDNGIYGSIALIDNVPLNIFSVSFVWFGGNNSPGAQPFEVYNENFEIISQGITTPMGLEPVPEPGTSILVCFGLLVFIFVSPHALAGTTKHVKNTVKTAIGITIDSVLKSKHFKVLSYKN